MKNFLRVSASMAIAVLIFCFYGCKDDKDDKVKISLNPTEILDVPANGNTYNVTVSIVSDNDVEWSVTPNENWLTIGTKTATTFPLTVARFEGGTADREGSVTVEAGGVRQTLKIKQKFDGYTLQIKSEDLSFEAAGGTLDVTVEADVDWTVSVRNAPAWLTVEKESDTKFTVTATAFRENDTRTATIVVTAASVNGEETLGVSQKGQPSGSGDFGDTFESYLGSYLITGKDDDGNPVSVNAQITSEYYNDVDIQYYIIEPYFEDSFVFADWDDDGNFLLDVAYPMFTQNGYDIMFNMVTSRFDAGTSRTQLMLFNGTGDEIPVVDKEAKTLTYGTVYHYDPSHGANMEPYDGGPLMFGHFAWQNNQPKEQVTDSVYELVFKKTGPGTRSHNVKVPSRNYYKLMEQKTIKSATFTRK